MERQFLIGEPESGVRYSKQLRHIPVLNPPGMRRHSPLARSVNGYHVPGKVTCDGDCDGTMLMLPLSLLFDQGISLAVGFTTAQCRETL